MNNKNLNIKIPRDKLDATINNAIKRGDKVKFKDTFKKVAAACLVVGGIATFNFAKPATAEKLPIIGDVFHKINISLGINKNSDDYIKYAQKISEIAKSNGIQLKITEAILDDHNNLILSYEIKNENGFSTSDKGNLSNTLGNLNIEGLKRVSFQPNYNEDAKKVEKMVSDLSKDGRMMTLNEDKQGVLGEFIDNNTFIGKAEYDLSSFGEIPNNFKVKLNINKLNVMLGSFMTIDKEKTVGYTPLNGVQGNWNLEFEVKKTNIKEAKTIKTNIISENVIVNDVAITPFTADISAKVDFSKINKLKVVDENNKEYSDYNTINKKENDSKFTDITFRFKDINKDVKNLKLIFLNSNNDEVFSCSIKTN